MRWPTGGDTGQTGVATGRTDQHLRRLPLIVLVPVLVLAVVLVIMVTRLSGGLPVDRLHLPGVVAEVIGSNEPAQPQPVRTATPGAGSGDAAARQAELGTLSQRVLVQTNPGQGAYLRTSPSWGDHQDIVVPEGGEVEVLQSPIWAEGRFWYQVRVVATGMVGYLPVDLTNRSVDLPDAEPTIAPRQ